MRCPQKGCDGKTMVLDTSQRGGLVIRKRGCKECGQTFQTSEQPARQMWVPYLGKSPT